MNHGTLGETAVRASLRASRVPLPARTEPRPLTRPSGDLSPRGEGISGPLRPPDVVTGRFDSLPPELMQLGQVPDFQIDAVRLRIIAIRVEPDGEHPRGPSSGNVGYRAVTDHGCLPRGTAQPLDGDLEQRLLGFTDRRWPHSGRDGDRLGNRAAAGIERTRSHRKPCIEIDREKRRPRRDRPGGRAQAIVAEIMVDPDDNRSGLMPSIDRKLCVTRGFHDPADIVGADHQDRRRTKPALDFFANQVEGSENLRCRRGDSKVC